jgi:hypothetical protein
MRISDPKREWNEIYIYIWDKKMIMNAELEEDNHDLFQGTILAFMWRDLRKSREPLAIIASNSDKIWPGYISNTGQNKSIIITSTHSVAG